MISRAAMALPVVAIALIAGGCGGDDNGTATTSTTPTEGTALQLAADPNGALAFDTDTLEAQPGSVTIELTNDSSVPHNVEVEGEGVDETSETITGSSTSLILDLESGTYDFYCNVPGHREAGMEGTLTVG